MRFHQLAGTEFGADQGFENPFCGQLEGIVEAGFEHHRAEVPNPKHVHAYDAAALHEQEGRAVEPKPKQGLEVAENIGPTL